MKRDPDLTVRFESAAIPGAFLRMDVINGPSQNVPDGLAGGIVNCQFGGDGPLERFRSIFRGGTEDLFECNLIRPGTASGLRMDGTGVTKPVPSGAGIVNVSFGVGIFSKFLITVTQKG